MQDQALFPTDNFTSAPPLPRASEMAADPSHYIGKTSGFPQRFEKEIKNMYKQMFRCYAHLYWQHWLLFWDISAHRELNTCFVHFINVGAIFNLLNEKDMEPMVPLVELWVNMGVLPKREGSGVGSPTAGVTGGATAGTVGSASGTSGAEKTTA